ncbi:MAG TPA: DUF2807 domain-containing protein [Sphingomicrobium sp.]
MRSFVPLFVAAFVASAPALATESVPVPQFRAIELHGGGVVNVVPGSTQRVTLVEGSSQFTRFRVDRGGKLVIGACNENCPRHYRLLIQIEMPSPLALGVNGGGLIQTGNGFPPQRAIGLGVNGGGKIDARSIQVVNAGAAVNGGGEIFVRASKTLAAAVKGGGEIRYWGNPVLATSVQGGGAVRRGQ